MSHRLFPCGTTQFAIRIVCQWITDVQVARLAHSDQVAPIIAGRLAERVVNLGSDSPAQGRYRQVAPPAVTCPVLAEHGCAHPPPCARTTSCPRLAHEPIVQRVLSVPATVARVHTGMSTRAREPSPHAGLSPDRDNPARRTAVRSTAAGTSAPDRSRARSAAATRPVAPGRQCERSSRQPQSSHRRS